MLSFEPIVSAPAAVQDRLADLGLEAGNLRESLRSGLTYLMSLTAHDTPLIKGPGVYNAINKTLALLHEPLGWNISDSRGFRRLVHPHAAISIVVHAGDRSTGLPDMLPSNSYPFMEGKRQALRNAIAHNNLLVRYRQGHFADVSAGWGRCLTYLLLHRISPDEIRAELSLPTRIDNSYIVDFHERIILPPDPSTGICVTDDEGPDISFEVTEKGLASA